ncbi:LysR family transcriptional regulator [Vibrio scophthalmi]|uniref:LysR family transcriptional regulator n=1 Tax=Vibrio scophthalmi TaxID=45658 RepID=UPI002FF16F43
MAKDLFAKLDLNLLKIFIILYQEQNMRRAAERLYVSQPAVSKSLQKLRDHFDDPLFVKTQKGLKPTEFSDKLADNTVHLIDQLSIAVNTSYEFDPSLLNGTIKIALSPFMLSSCASELFFEIRQQAPDVQLQMLNWSSSTMDEILKGEVMLGVNYDIDYVSKELIRTRVGADHFHAYVRQDHPFTGSAITLDQALKYEIATVIAADWNAQTSFAEKLIRIKGLDMKLGFRSESPYAVVDVVAHSDMLMPGSNLATVDHLGFLRKIPILVEEDALQYDIYLFYHNKNRHNQTVLWLKRLLAKIIQSKLH